MTFRSMRPITTKISNVRRGVMCVSTASFALAALLLSATPAAAHVGGRTGGLADGWSHPLLGPDHLLAMVAVGVIAAVMTPSARRPLTAVGLWAAPIAFFGGMTIGGAGGLAGWSFPAVELTIVASVIALGIAVAGAIGNAGHWVPLLLVAGLAHGNAHGAEAPAANALLYVAGFLSATVLLHVIGVLGGTVVRRNAVLRVAVGTTFAAAGVLLLN